MTLVSAATAPVPHLARRLARALALQTIVGLGLVCVVVYLAIAWTLTDRQREALDHKQTAIEHLLSESRGVHSPEALRHMLNDFLTGHDELSLRIVSASGRNIYALTRQPEDAVRSTVRRFAVDVPVADGGVQTMQAVLWLDQRPDDRLLGHLAWTLALAAVAGALLVSLASTWLVRLGLRPLHSLVEQTRSLSAQELHRRLDDSHQPQELRPLIAQFNALLDRLAVAYQQMEAFNADVAHELNTPLTTLISSCELALRKPRGEAELQEILASNLEDLQRMAGIVADMLFLSHADRGAEARRSHVPSLAALAEEVAEFHEASLQEAQLQVRIEGDAKAAVDERLLRRALSNLLGNATRYGRPGSTVVIEIGVEPATPAAGNGLWAHQHLRLAVRNAGVEIDPQQLPRIFDRFYRAEVARTHADRNHGLGLAIVAAIARMHDGEAFAESAHGETRIGLVLPVH
ncbi:MAG: heavy metal sensor histidine kinase [Acidovorax sp.]|jgi:two-component system heavy metal sensor histidine kinase CusS|nr:heavy metal sensor histidine kinase [Acidovorax sp.]MDR3003518.1 heavy metal sensor histidine kinase [Acidovorax sp.]